MDGRDVLANRPGNPDAGPGGADTPIQHYIMILGHRKWLVIAIFLIVSAATAIVSVNLPKIYTSETLILVDPQQVPSNYVEPTVTGDIENRLNTLSQQILSATRLQKIIDTFGLYPEERKKLQPEDLINLMRKDITVQVVSGPARERKQDLQAFRITYSGKDPRTTAQVTNKLASLFIEENLKAREQMAVGTTDFLASALEQTRKKLEKQEAEISAFKLKHLGEMPEQERSTLQILAQLQSQLQMLSDSLDRAQQQRAYLQALAASLPASAPNPNAAATQANEADGPIPDEVKLNELLTRYGENYPDVKRLKLQIQQEKREREKQEQEAKKAGPQVAAAPAGGKPPGNGKPPSALPITIGAQLAQTEAEIENDKRDQRHLLTDIAMYQKRLEDEPLREQEIAGLMRDYTITKQHYSSLLSKENSAQMATELEIRQQGEKFTILDPAQVPQKPSKPNLLAINAGGCAGGLALGLAVALATEFIGLTITSPIQAGTAAGIAVLGVIPVITTPFDRRRRKRWMVAGATAALAVIMAVGLFLLVHFRYLIL